MIAYLQIFVLISAIWLSAICFVGREEPREHVGIRMIFVVCGIYALTILCNLFIPVEYQFIRMIWSALATPVMCLAIFACWKLSVSLSFYYAMWSFMLWQLLCELWLIIVTLYCYDISAAPVNNLIISILIFGIGNILIFFTIAKWMPEDRNKKIGPRQLISAIVIYSAFEICGFAISIDKIKRENGDWRVIYMTQVLLLLILYLQSELFKKSVMRQELAVMNMLWTKEQEQYELSRENIALINQKCHDLKHQIRAIRNMKSEEIDDYLKEMEDSVKIYESMVKSGNEVLDTILTEKSLYCKERGITVSCIADGSQLGFMNTIDLYAILGNAMDNAIEAVEKFEQVEKRQIDVCIYRNQQFLVINITNPTKEKLCFESELPKTTKEDHTHHGFGLKSIQYMVKKYQGFLNISEEDNCFSLKILIPIPESVST